VVPLQGKLGKLTDLLALVPDLLGADGQQRNYVIVAQNNVEIRSTGGFAGAWCPVHAVNGSVSLGDVTDVYGVIPTNSDVMLDITDEEFNLFGGSISYIPGNDGLDPDFPRVCDLWSQFWSIYQYETLDGVIALDPVLFQSTVGLSGGVTLEDGTAIDGTNTVRTLLHDVYWNYMDYPDLMNEYFAMAAGAAAHGIVDNLGNMDLADLFTAVNNAIDDGHLFLWLADADGQAVLSELNCTGELTYDETEPVLGVYLSNCSYSKIEWWLDESLVVGNPVTNADGSLTYPVSLELTNTVTWDEINAANANAYIYGSSDLKYSIDDMVDWLFLYAPAGGYIDGIQTQGAVELTEGTHNGLQVYFGLAHMLIDQPVSVTFQVTVSPRAAKELAVRKTPTVQDYR
jgi:hypothetical protein